MGLIVTISGSPSVPSRSSLLARHVGAQLAASGHQVEAVNVRDLPPEDLVYGRTGTAAIKDALGAIARAQGVVVVTPVYKASYTGVLKSFLDLLPQFGLTGKVVLPLATGGTVAHVLAIDYALRPVLASLGALHVVGGLFLFEKLLQGTDTGGLEIDIEARPRLAAAIADFERALGRAHGDVVPVAAPVSTSASVAA
jgi:FMN reductase